MGDAAFIEENESKAAKLFAARRLRSEKYSQCGWGTCSEASDTEFVSDSEEELDFTDTDVPDFIEPVIRSNTPSEPEQHMYAKGKGAKLFRKRQERMNNYTKTGQGKLTGLPTGKLTDRQRCGYVAKTKYDLIKMEEMEQQATMEAASKSAANNDPRKAADFIDFTMPPPKKITLPKVEIQKPDGPLPFQYMRPSQYNGGELLQRPNSACGRLSSMSDCGSQRGGFGSSRPWNGAAGQQYKSVKPPVKNMNFSGINQVVNKPLPRTEFGSEIGHITSANYRKINFQKPKAPKKGVTKDIHALPKAKNVTALGFKKPLEGRINVTDRRMSVKDLIVNGDEPYQPMKMPPIPSSPRSASRSGMLQDSQTAQHLHYIDDREERCPTRAQAPTSMYAPRKIVPANANVWTPQRA